MPQPRQNAGSGRPVRGWRKSWATSAASVLLPPLPNVRSRPPASNPAADVGVDQGDADLLQGLTGVDQGQLAGPELHDPDGHGHVAAGDADVVVALGDRHRAAASSTPGCSKKTCTSSHSTWYTVTW